ncbi:MAG: alpha/beta hydrolase [Lactobacillaceae bacterium]|nr:alpha/beta hydrolase [Lactobacillaceae bacterium]
MKKISIRILIGIVILGLVIVQVVHQRTMESVPTILVPGSTATQNRFNGLLAKLNNTSDKHSVLKITVQKDGSLQTSGTIKASDKRPYIVIAFAENGGGTANINKQAKWLKSTMLTIHKKYRFTQYNALGHSNGGLIWVRYLEAKRTLTTPKIKTLLTIGTPYNATQNDVHHRTKLLTSLIKQRAKLPHQMQVFSIAGTVNYNNDDVVPVTSVVLGKYIFQSVVAKYTFMTVSSKTAAHSELVTNDDVIEVIKSKIFSQADYPVLPGCFIWGGT